MSLRGLDTLTFHSVSTRDSLRVFMAPRRSAAGAQRRCGQKRDAPRLSVRRNLQSASQPKVPHIQVRDWRNRCHRNNAQLPPVSTPATTRPLCREEGGTREGGRTWGVNQLIYETRPWGGRGGGVSEQAEMEHLPGPLAAAGCSAQISITDHMQG